MNKIVCKASKFNIFKKRKVHIKRKVVITLSEETTTTHANTEVRKMLESPDKELENTRE